MKLARVLMMVTLGTALTACQSHAQDQAKVTPPAAHHHHHGHDHHGHQHNHGTSQNVAQNAKDKMTGQRAVFECKNNTVHVEYLNADHIRVRTATDSSTTVLSAASAGSGELYANPNGFYGKPTELHIKGNDAHFMLTDPYNNQVTTSCKKK